MKKVILMILLTLCASTIALADHGNGDGKGLKGANISVSHIGDVPPGLEGKGRPSGLIKQDKTPPGWSRGEKTGWDNDRDRWNIFDWDSSHDRGD